MTTARDIITKALNKVGAGFKGQAPASDEVNDALDMLNNLLQSLSNDSMLVYTRTWETFTLSTNTASYTIGTGKTFNTAKPLLIVESHIKNGNTDYPLAKITDENYNSLITDKTVGGIPTYFNYDNGHTFGTIRLYPVPQSAYQIFLLTEKELTTFALDDDVLLPAGWERMLIYNLAVELFPEYEQQIDQVVLKIAEDAKRLVRANIIRNRSMDALPMTVKSRSFNNGWY